MLCVLALIGHRVLRNDVLVRCLQLRRVLRVDVFFVSAALFNYVEHLSLRLLVLERELSLR